jgi:ankyrin repeat protein
MSKTEANADLRSSEMRSRDKECRDPKSAASRRAVLKMAAKSHAERKNDLHSFAQYDCANLIRCAFAVKDDEGKQMSPDTCLTALSVPLLCIAASFGASRAFKALLEAGADVSQTDAAGHTVLHYAAMHDEPACIDATISAGALLDTKTKEGATPLVAAVQRGSEKVFLKLLSIGADIKEEHNGHPLLSMAVQFGRHPIISRLLERGADARYIDSCGNSLLMNAIIHGDAEAAALLIDASDLEHFGSQGRNALHICVIQGSDTCFDQLLPRVSDVDVSTCGSEEGKTALYLACMFGRIHMASALLARGASPMARCGKFHASPLHAAAINGRLSSMTVLLNLSDVNAETTNGATALHYTIHCKYPEAAARCAGALVAAGARLDACNFQGISPLTYAEHHCPEKTLLIEVLGGKAATPLPGTVCDGCNASSLPLKPCSGCCSALYCGSECSLTRWAAHTAECRLRTVEDDKAKRLRRRQRRAAELDESD